MTPSARFENADDVHNHQNGRPSGGRPAAFADRFVATEPTVTYRWGVVGLTAFTEELAEAGAGAVSSFTRFTLHLSDEDVDRLDRRLLAVLDEFMATDRERRDQPTHGGIIVLHRMPD